MSLSSRKSSRGVLRGGGGGRKRALCLGAAIVLIPLGSLWLGGSTQEPPAPESSELAVEVMVFRIWESMRAAERGVAVRVGSSWTPETLLSEAGRRLLTHKGLLWGSQRGAGAVRELVSEDGSPLLTVQDALRAGSAFALVGTESFLFPTQHGTGVTFSVALPNASAPLALAVLSESPRVLLAHGLLSRSECGAIIELARPRMRGSVVRHTAGKFVTQERTSTTAFLREGDGEVFAAVRRRVAALARVPESWLESMQVVHYLKGDHYVSHQDYFEPERFPDDYRWKTGHNRFLTVLLYLSDGVEGGETVFPYAGVPAQRVNPSGPCEAQPAESLHVRPQLGSAVLFYSLQAKGHERGVLDPRSLHAACDVRGGEKWAANFWIRNGPVLPPRGV